MQYSDPCQQEAYRGNIGQWGWQMLWLTQVGSSITQRFSRAKVPEGLLQGQGVVGLPQQLLIANGYRGSSQ